MPRKSKRGKQQEQRSQPERRSARIDEARSRSRQNDPDPETTVTEVPEVILPSEPRSPAGSGISPVGRGRESSTPGSERSRVSTSGSGGGQLGNRGSQDAPPPNPVMDNGIRYAVAVYVRTRTRECALGHLPRHTWTIPIIRDMLQPQTIQEITEIVPLRDGDVIVFAGERDRRRGFTLPEAVVAAEAYKGETLWVGRPVTIDTRIFTLEEAAREIERSLVPLENPFPWEFFQVPPPHMRIPPMGLRYNLNNHANQAQLEREPRREDRYEPDFEIGSVLSESSDATSRTATQGGRLGKIHINKFGDKDVDAISYRAWRADVVRCRDSGHNRVALLSEVVHSLVGSPGSYVRSLGTDFDLDQLLEKLDEYFGLATSNDTLHSTFFLMSQRPDEKVGAFGLRLETHLNVLQRKCPGSLGTPEEANQVLRDRFFNGVHERLRSKLIHKVDRDNPAPYGDLVAFAREEEEHYEAKKLYASKTDSSVNGKGRSTLPYKKYKDGVNAQVKAVQMVAPAPDEDEEEDDEDNARGNDSSLDELLSTSDVSSENWETIITKVTQNVEASMKRCWTCGSPDHLSNKCPDNPRSLNYKGGRTNPKSKDKATPPQKNEQ